MNPRTAVFSLLLLSIEAIATELPSIRSQVTFDGLDRIRISWATQAGDSYFLQTTTNLAEPWQDIETDPPLLAATTNQLAYELFVTNQIKFIRVGWRDAQGPRLVPIYPRFDGIAVPRGSILQMRLSDPSRVDTNSIQLSIGNHSPITLADDRLTFTNNILTYKPNPAESLGDYGEHLTATVVATDGVGNRATNSWPFQLELQTVLSTNIFQVGGPPLGGAGLASPPALTLLSRNGFTLQYRYSGGTSGLRQGLTIYDSTPGRGFVLVVLAVVEDPTTQTVSVFTEQASLADLIKEGSLSTRNIRPNPQGGIGQHIWWEAGMDLAFEHTVPLKKELFAWRDGGNFIRAELTDTSQLVLKANAGFAANFRNFTLKEFEAYAGGSAALDLELYAEGNYKKEYEGTLALITPIYAHFTIPVGSIPVEVTTKFEVDLPYELSFQAQGHFRNGIKVDKEIYMGRKWDGEWHDTSRYPPLTFQWSPVEWQVAGTIKARVDVQPKMTALIYGLVGPYSDLDPYLELEGWGQINPWQYEWGLYGGLDAHLGCDLTVFDRLFPNLSFEQEYVLISKTRITGDGNVVKAPRIVMQPHDQMVSVGGLAGFSVFAADGTPPFWFQWQRNGENLIDDARITGAQRAVLRIADVRQSDAGSYRVGVRNSAGEVISAEVTLTVSDGGQPHVIPGMVWIPPGTFTMGSPASEPGRWSNEGPQTRVTISKGFWMGKYEVTQGDYQALMGSNPSQRQGANLPVETVSWHDAVAYCTRLTQQERAAGRLQAGYEYRLPTEAQWEYACRAGTTTPFHYGNELRSGMASFLGKYEYPPCGDSTRYCFNLSGTISGTTPVGSYAPNAWGLYDMHGNVWEWCQDWYGSSLKGDSVTNPKGPTSGAYRVDRGGGHDSIGRDCRSAHRNMDLPESRENRLGFRVALVQVP